MEKQNTIEQRELVEERKVPVRRNYVSSETISFESIFVAFVFFAVLSQFLLTGELEGISQPFRPLIILILTVQVVRRGSLYLPVRNVAVVMSVYQLILWFFLYPNGGAIRLYLVVILFFMMLYSVSGFPWNRRELKLIIYACFIATFICALIFFFSNDMLDFSVHDMRFMGTIVNRNKNAYAFAFGVVLGRFCLAYGKDQNRLLIFLMILLEVYCLLYSQCRGAFGGVCIAAGVVALFRILQMRKSNNPYLIFYILTIIAISILAYILIKNSAFSRLVDSESMSGRDEAMNHARELFRQASLFGKIFGNGMLYEESNTVGAGVHFVYLTYLLEAGIIGTILLILIFVTAVRSIHGEFSWTLFIFALSRTFFEGMDYYIFIPLILSICITNYERLFNRPWSELLSRRRHNFVSDRVE